MDLNEVAMPFLPWLLLVVCMALASGCAVNPATGRDDFVLMDEAAEQELGIRYNQDVQQRYPRYPDAQLQAYVQQVGDRVARYSHRPDLVFIFTVIDSPDLNAFALPGGYIYVHRGLLAYLGSEAELAAVLAHEIGHVTARHGARQRSQSQAWGQSARWRRWAPGWGPWRMRRNSWAGRWCVATVGRWSCRPTSWRCSTSRAVAMTRRRW